MDHKQLCVANLKYKKPIDSKQTKGLLRYLTYRDSRDGHIKQMSGQERWVDHGLGSSVGEIAETCDRYQSDHVLAFTLVFNPNPLLLAMVPEKKRGRFVRELTESTLDRFFEERGLETGVEYSYVTHFRPSEDPEAPGLPDPHTHVILPGTVFDEGQGNRVPLFFSRNRQGDHIELLHHLTEEHMVDLLDRTIGRDWEQRIDALEAIREQQRKIVDRQPDGEFIDPDGQSWPVWAGVRRTTEEVSAAGIYRHFPTKDGQRLEFRPLLLNMPHEMADEISNMFAAHLRLYPDATLKQVEGFAEQLSAYLKGEGEAPLELGLDIDDSAPPSDPELSLDQRSLDL